MDSNAPYCQAIMLQTTEASDGAPWSLTGRELSANQLCWTEGPRPEDRAGSCSRDTSKHCGPTSGFMCRCVRWNKTSHSSQQSSDCPQIIKNKQLSQKDMKSLQTHQGTGLQLQGGQSSLKTLMQMKSIIKEAVLQCPPPHPRDLKGEGL